MTTTRAAPTLQLEARSEHSRHRRAHSARDAVRAHTPKLLCLDRREGIGDISDRGAALRRVCRLSAASVRTSAIHLGEFITHLPEDTADTWRVDLLRRERGVVDRLLHRDVRVPDRVHPR